MNKLKVILLLFVAISVAGCATSIKLKVKRSPEINLGGVQEVKVEPFAVSGNLDLDLMNQSSGLLGAVTGIAVSAGANKLAESKHSDIRNIHYTDVKNVIFRDGYYKITEGDNKDTTIRGNIFYDVKDQGSEKETKDKDGNPVKSYAIKRSADVRVNFTVADKSGSIIGSAEVSSQASKSSSGKNRNEARRGLRNWDQLVKQALAKTHKPFIRKIAPYFVWEKRTLEKGDSDLIKEGNKAADKGNWEHAVTLWNKAKSSGVKEDEIATTYNLAIYDEVQGRLATSTAKI